MTTIYMRERKNDLTMAYKYKKKQKTTKLFINKMWFLFRPSNLPFAGKSLQNY